MPGAMVTRCAVGTERGLKSRAGYLQWSYVLKGNKAENRAAKWAEACQCTNILSDTRQMGRACLSARLLKNKLPDVLQNWCKPRTVLPKAFQQKHVQFRACIPESCEEED